MKQAVPTQESRKCGKYNCYTPEQRASIGKYAAENGPTKAARHFTKILGSSVNESTARKLRSEYLRELNAVKDGDLELRIDAIPKKSQGRPLLLGKELDGIIQEYIRGLKSNKAVVNTSIVMAVGEGILLSK